MLHNALADSGSLSQPKVQIKEKRVVPCSHVIQIATLPSHGYTLFSLSPPLFKEKNQKNGPSATT